MSAGKYKKIQAFKWGGIGPNQIKGTRVSLRSGGWKSVGYKFVRVTPNVLVGDREFATYLRRAKIQKAKRGGTFVGNYDVAPESFRQYGIVLPNGGMIIPDATPETLRDMVNETESKLRADHLKKCRNEEKEYLARVKEMLAKSDLDDVEIRVSDSPSHRKSFFVRAEEEIFLLHREEWHPHGCLNKKLGEPVRTHFTPLEKVRAFLREEVRLVEPRKLFANRINRLVEMSHAVGQKKVGEDDWGRPRVELFLYDEYDQPNDWGFFGHRCKSVFSAHRIMYRNNLYELHEKDIARLESEVGKRSAEAAERQEMLKRMFFEELGVFSSYETRTYEPLETRRSFVDGRVKDDSWTERHYFLRDVEVTREEYEWLNTFLGEVKVPDGYIRVANDTNKLLKIPEMPGKDDELVIIGKTGSRRGVPVYGELFRGHPSQCTTSFWSRKTLSRIESVVLNGKVQESKTIHIALWTDPREIARIALKKAGVENPEREDVEALAEVYRQQLGK